MPANIGETYDIKSKSAAVKQSRHLLFSIQTLMRQNLKIERSMKEITRRFLRSVIVLLP